MLIRIIVFIFIGISSVAKACPILELPPEITLDLLSVKAREMDGLPRDAEKVAYVHRLIYEWGLVLTYNTLNWVQLLAESVSKRAFLEAPDGRYNGANYLNAGFNLDRERLLKTIQQREARIIDGFVFTRQQITPRIYALVRELANDPQDVARAARIDKMFTETPDLSGVELRCLRELAMMLVEDEPATPLGVLNQQDRKALIRRLGVAIATKPAN